VPINPRNFGKRSDELKVVIAGIVANIILAFILALPIRFALVHGNNIDSSTFLTFLNLVVEINLILAAFNLLPIFPLDGSHFVEYFLDDAARETYQSVGPYILLGLLLLDRLGNYSIISTLMEPILRVLSLLVKGTFSLGG
jgi:Zn-dependent protease